MATIKAKTIDLALTIEWTGVSDVGEPMWLSARVQVHSAQDTLLREVVNVTTGDIREIHRSLQDSAVKRAGLFAVTTGDDNLVIETEPAGLPGDVYLGLWLGEPYGLMKGFRFVVPAQDLRAFASGLLRESIAYGSDLAP